MSEARATGIILRTRRLTETSLIVHWLTGDLGRVATVARGARRRTSPFFGRLDLFFKAEFSFQRSRRSDLHTLREVRLQETHARVRQEFGWFEQAGYAAGLVESATEVEAPMPGVFDLMAGFLAHLTTRPPAPTTVLAFELRLLTELGLQPELGTAPLTAGSRAAARTLAGVDWPGLAALRLSDGQARELGGFLGQHLAAQWFRVPASRNEALRV